MRKGEPWWKEPPALPQRLCCLCGGLLSRYNPLDRCSFHPDPKVEQEIRAGREELQKRLQIVPTVKVTAPPSTERIIEVLCEECGVSPEELSRATRKAPIVLSRHILMYLLSRDGGLTSVGIGTLLGGRDHSTVLHGIAKIDTAVSNGDRRIQNSINRIRGLYKPLDP